MPRKPKSLPPASDFCPSFRHTKTFAKNDIRIRWGEMQCKTNPQAQHAIFRCIDTRCSTEVLPKTQGVSTTIINAFKVGAMFREAYLYVNTGFQLLVPATMPSTNIPCRATHTKLYVTRVYARIASTRTLLIKSQAYTKAHTDARLQLTGWVLHTACSGLICVNVMSPSVLGRVAFMPM